MGHTIMSWKDEPVTEVDTVELGIEDILTAYYDGEEDKAMIRFFVRECLPVLAGKGGDYGARRKYFSDIANQVHIDGVDKYVVWFVLFTKHVKALASWVSKRKLNSEPVKGRIVDMINYLLILTVLMKREEE